MNVAGRAVSLFAFWVFMMPCEVVVASHVRITPLTDRLIRMEWSADGRFEDRPTLTFVSREGAAPCERRVDGERISVDTGKVRVEYSGGGRFSSDNLKATFGMSGRQVTWRYGDDEGGNLWGTRRTLDWVEDWATLFENKCGKLERGLLSRDGWAVVDDSAGHVLADCPAPWGKWAEVRPAGDRQDIYLFAYGHDYRAALRDYTRFAGRMPMPPKWAFGYWWSRWWEYSDDELRDLVRTIRSHDIPLDVLIIDMDWHRIWTLGTFEERRDEFGQRVGWTGYSWNRRLFPSPANFFAWCRREHLKTALNLHPASGIQPHEDCFAAFAADYGWRGTNAVPFAIDDRKWCDSYFRTVLDPIMREGVDFWWLDWQQWLNSKLTPGLSNTFWLNRTFFDHAEEFGRAERMRPMIYHRWGGLGSHRYQVGFSGDVVIRWEALEMLPFFTATAANVGYGYWGHDIGGHKNIYDNGRDAELFTRWLQSGVFMPLFKTHPGKVESIERRIWKYPGHFETMREAFHLRYRLAPYVYTAARKAYDTGVAVCHPLYYDWPEAEEAYNRRYTTHMFGDDLLAVTIARPADPTNGLAAVDVWLPPGRWYDAALGAVREGGGILHGKWTIDENPRLYREGAVVPLYPADVRNLQTAPSDRLEVAFVPGGEGGETEVYEDDGETTDYRGRFAKTRVAWRETPGEVTVDVAPRKGAYDGMAESRSLTLRFPRRMPPARVVADGRELRYAREGGEGTWTYDGRGLEVVVECPSARCDRAMQVRLEFALTDHGRLNGLKGAFLRAAKLGEEFKTLYNRHVAQRAAVPADYLAYTLVANAIADEPSRIIEILEARDAARMGFLETLGRFEGKMPPEFLQKLRAQLQDN